MAARGDVGVTIDVTKMPVREEGMTPYEILLSESQERMLVVALRGHEAHVKEILAKWDLSAEVIGEVIADPVYRVTEGDRVVAEFPGSRLVTDCPVYHPDARESETIAALRARDVDAIRERPEERDAAWTLRELLSSPTIASKAWVYRQYDTSVRTNTMIGPGGDAAVLRLRGTRKALAVKTDCNGRYVYLDPRVGGRIAVAESARNVACTGARPKAITNCLNFGNPKRPEVFFQFREAVGGMAEACEALGTPVTGGNVSLYNESPSGAVFPTPVVGMVGVADDVDHVTRATFQAAGDAIVLLGEPTSELGASEYLARIHGVTAGAPPACDLRGEQRLIDALLESIQAGAVSSAHDCSDGGFAVALAECAMANREKTFSAAVDLSSWSAISRRALLFGEAQGRVIVSTDSPADVERIAAKHGVPARRIGVVELSGRPFRIQYKGGELVAPIEQLANAYHNAIPSIMTRVAVADDALAADAPSTVAS
jgi:phosphoribosylformylglycinamidine synthase